MNKLLVSFLFLSASTICLPAYAEVAVIVNSANADNLTKDELSAIYMGKSKSFPSGEHVTIYIQAKGSSADEFNRTLLEKSTAQFKSYWSKLAFSGKATPPKSASDDLDMKEAVASDPSAIGYIDATLVDETVKVIDTY